MAKTVVTDKDDLSTARLAAEQVAKMVFDKLSSVSTAADKVKFFPGGVTVIDVKVKVATIEVAVRIEGKCDPKNAAADGGFQPQ